jgi:hypothetical protein
LGRNFFLNHNIRPLTKSYFFLFLKKNIPLYIGTVLKMGTEGHCVCVKVENAFDRL